MTALSILLPIRVDDIDAETLTALARQVNPEARAETVEIRGTIDGTATKIRLAVRWNAPARACGLPENLVLKGGFGAHREAMAFLYRQEVQFYAALAEPISINAPRCWGWGSDDAAGHHLVLIEDLDARGAMICRVGQPLGVPRTLEFLDLTAMLHARTWEGTGVLDAAIWDTMGTFAALPSGAAGAYARGQLQTDVYHQFMQAPRSLAVSRVFHDRDNMQRALERIDVATSGQPQCMVHGDLHLGNVYIDSRDQPAVLDWQCYGRGHWSHDVTYFMVSALDQAQRRRSDRELLTYYLERLRHHGAPAVPDFAEAWRFYRLQIAYGLFYWMVNPPEWQAEENNCSVAPRFADAALDHGLFDDI